MTACAPCGKVAHADAGAAHAAKVSFAKSLGGTNRLGIYPCPAGNGWHVGHRPGTLVKDLKRIRRQQAAVRASLRGSRRRKRR